MFKKIILSTAAVLLLTPFALADHRDRDDYRYSRGPSVADLSHELEQATRQVHRAAERRAHPRNRFAREALYSLHRLKQSARQFHKTVEYRGNARRQVQRDFNRLLAAYDAAAHHVSYARSRQVREDFKRVSRLIRRLTSGLDFASRHGRERYDRDGRDRRYGDARAERSGSHGSVVFGDSNGQTQYRVRVRW